jgi:co-chaperonin GroES (HSP10)
MESEAVMENISGITPTEFKVLVLVDEESENEKRMKAMGLVMSPDAAEREKHKAFKGTVIALSPVAFTYENFPAGTRLPGPGDRVCFAKYAGSFITGKDFKEYRIMNDRDISAIIDF